MTTDSPRLAICIMTETFHPVTGGGETQARALAEGLSAGGDTVCLITRRSDPAMAKHEHIGGVDIYRTAPVGAGHFRKWGMVFTAFVSLLGLRKQIDVILVCGFRVLGLPALALDLLFGRPCVLKADSQGELSGAFFDPGLKRLHLRHDRLPVNIAVWMRNAVLRRAARFVSISSVIEQEYVAGGVPAERIASIPNSVDADKFCPVDDRVKIELRGRLGLPGDCPVAVYTGRLVTTKGLPSLVRAWQLVLEEFPDAILNLVGSGGLGIQNCEEALRQYVADHSLQASVRFSGAVENVQEHLQAGDIFVFPSEREAFGISVIEAMACRLPVVTTDVDGICDVVRPDIEALVVVPGNDKALAAAIVRAFRGGSDISAMARLARERVLQRYTTKSVVDAYRTLLAGALRE